MKHVYPLAGAWLSALFLAACAGSASVAPIGEHGAPPTRVRGIPASSSCLTSTCIYVGSSEPYGQRPHVHAYAGNARGNATPLQDIKGTVDIPNRPTGVAVDADRNVYVIGPYGSESNQVLVYPAGSNGKVDPQTIGGSNTFLNEALSIAIDAGNNIYVGSTAGSPSSSYELLVFAAGALGNVSPIQIISGGNTELNEPQAVAVDSSGNIYAANVGAASITVYAAGANGNAGPIQTISGSNTGLDILRGVAVDASRNIYVLNYSCCLFNVNVYGPGANGNVSPIRTIAGKRTGLTDPSGIALDATGRIFVANRAIWQSAPSNVLVFSAGATGNVKPIRVIAGSHTGLKKFLTFSIAVR